MNERPASFFQRTERIVAEAIAQSAENVLWARANKLDEHLSPEMFLSDFGTCIVNTGRRTGLTTALMTCALRLESPMLVANHTLLDRLLYDSLLYQTPVVENQIWVASALDSPSVLKKFFETWGQTARYLFVDLPIRTSGREMDKIYRYATRLQNLDLIVTTTA